METNLQVICRFVDEIQRQAFHIGRDSDEQTAHELIDRIKAQRELDPYERHFLLMFMLFSREMAPSLRSSFFTIVAAMRDKWPYKRMFPGAVAELRAFFEDQKQDDERRVEIFLDLLGFTFLHDVTSEGR